AGRGREGRPQPRGPRPARLGGPDAARGLPPWPPAAPAPAGRAAGAPPQAGGNVTRQEIIVPGSRLKASTQPEWRRARLDMFARPLRRVTVGSMPLPLSEMLTCTTRSTPSENTLTEIATALA